MTRDVVLLIFLFFLSGMLHGCLSTSPTASTQTKSPSAALTARLDFDESWMEILQEIVDINSGSDNPAGSHAVFNRLFPIVEGLGFKHQLHEVSSGHHVLSFEMAESEPQLILVGHVDTVYPQDSPFQRMSRQEGVVKGPGVMDMKGGVIMMLHVLSLIDDPEILRRVRVVINDDEEIGSRYTKAKLQELAQGIPYGLVFEPAPDPDVVISSSSGVYWLEIETQGRAAHAGMDHHRGVNACVDLAAKLVEVSRLTDYEKGLTVNVGTIEGGTRPNVVCETASAKLDIRYRRSSDLDWLLKKVREIITPPPEPDAMGRQAATSKMSHVVSVSNLPEESSQTLLELAKGIGGRLEMKIGGMHSGYASDANHLSELGIKLLVGLGPYGQGMHTTDETMSIRSYRERVVFNRELLLGILGDEGRTLISSLDPPRD